MKWWRWYLLLLLFLFPVLLLSVLGFYYLLQTGWGWTTGWVLLGCIALAYFLALRWQKQQKLLQPTVEIPLAWTERDKQAWKLVERHAEQIKQMKGDQLLSLQTYQDTAQQLARELAQFYHPKSTDPLNALTIPEILTVVELATRDLAQMVDQYLPGGHLLRIRDFQRIKKAADWYPTIRNATWLLSGVFAPLNTVARYLTTNVGLTGPWQRLQDNALVWFFTAYVHRLGIYLVELNSGRLRVGARRYLALKEQFSGGGRTEAGADSSSKGTGRIKIVFLGQTNAGKSSLVNVLLGEQKALTDALPATTEARRYLLKPAGMEAELELVDTVGYGTHGPTQLQERATEKLVQSADAVLLVLHARSPGRQADVDQLKSLDCYFRGHPDLMHPPVLAVITHIDLLSPMMEWSPPYQWLEPKGAKEKSIHDAVLTAQQQLGKGIAASVPVCTASDKEFGVKEALLPALATVLNQAQAVALLRLLNIERNQDRVKKVFEQLLELGKGLINVLTEQSRK